MPTPEPARSPATPLPPCACGARLGVSELFDPDRHEDGCALVDRCSACGQREVGLQACAEEGCCGGEIALCTACHGRVLELRRVA